MTHRARILADRLIAAPAAFLFNGIARVLGFAMGRDHSMTPANVNHIVVAKLIGMGSVIQSKPLLQALKDQYPHAKVTYVTMRSNAELVRRLGCVDEVLTIDDRSLFAMARTTITTIAALIGRRADLYFDLEVYSAFASLIALCAVTRNRIGFYRHSVAFKHGIYTHLVFFNTRMPIRQLYLQLGRVVGVAPNQSELTGPIRIDDCDRDGAQRVLVESPGWQSNKPYIVVNPNASDLLLERRWPVEYFVETIERLVAFGHQVALIGIASERAYVQSLFDKLSREAQARTTNIAGLLSLGELLALLDRAACILTNDTGPMHMAIALNRPTVCLFGPANPEHYGQALQNVEIFYTQVFCSPCLYEAARPPCNGNNICMQRIEPAPVIKSILRMAGPASTDETAPTPLKPVRPRRRTTRLPIANDAPDRTPLGVVVRASLRGVIAP